MATQVCAACSYAEGRPAEGTSAWTTAPVTVTRRLARTATLVAVRSLAAADVDGTPVDRLVFEFRSDLPGYHIACCPVVYPPFEGPALQLRGSEYVEVTLFPATALDDQNWSTLVTSAYGHGSTAVAQYRLAGDYEGYLHFALGLAKGTEFRVSENSADSHLVLDFRVAGPSAQPAPTNAPPTVI